MVIDLAMQIKDEIKQLIADRAELQQQVDSLTAELEETQKKLKDCSREVFRRIAENNNLRSMNSFLNDTMTEQIAKLLDENDCIEVSERGIDGKRRLVTGTQRKLEKHVEELTAERDELERANSRQARKIHDVCGLNEKLDRKCDEFKAEIAKYEHDCGLLFDEKHKLEAERDHLTNAINNELQEKQPYCYNPEQPLDTLKTIGRYIDELTAERDELRDIIAHMPKTEAECEACQDAHDRLMFNAKVHQDELRDELKHKQLVIDRQRDSFAKMEREYRELQNVCGELERTIENLRGD